MTGVSKRMSHRQEKRPLYIRAILSGARSMLDQCKQPGIFQETEIQFVSLLALCFARRYFGRGAKGAKGSVSFLVVFGRVPSVFRHLCSTLGSTLSSSLWISIKKRRTVFVIICSFCNGTTSGGLVVSGAVSLLVSGCWAVFVCLSVFLFVYPVLRSINFVVTSGVVCWGISFPCCV